MIRGKQQKQKSLADIVTVSMLEIGHFVKELYYTLALSPRCKPPAAALPHCERHKIYIFPESISLAEQLIMEQR